MPDVLSQGHLSSPGNRALQQLPLSLQTNAPHSSAALGTYVHCCAGNAHCSCGGACSMSWRFYDFDANWDKVYKVWQGDAVQDALEPEMEAWYEQHAYFDQDEDGNLHRPTWNRGDSLWQ